MNITKKEALTLWDYAFGHKTNQAQDCFGSWMVRSDYGDYKTKRRANDGNYYNYGWDVDHIRPKTDYKVVLCVICGRLNKIGYGILDESNNHRVDWKAIKRTCI